MHADRVGVFTYGHQLIVRDYQRYLVWNQYLRRKDGCAADVVVGQKSGVKLSKRNRTMGRSMHALDHKRRLWATGENGQIMVFALPMKPYGKPLRDDIPLYWADDRERVAYHCGSALAFEARTRCL